MRFAAGPPDGPSLAEQAAGRSTAGLVAARADEAQRLMDAGMVGHAPARHDRSPDGGRDRPRGRAVEPGVLPPLRQQGRPRHRHRRCRRSPLAAYVERRMAAHDEPLDQVRAWVAAVLAQATDPKASEPTRAVSFNRNVLDVDREHAARQAESLVWAQLEVPLGHARSTPAADDAYLIGKLVFAVLTEALWSDEKLTDADLDDVAGFCIAAITN